MRKAFIIVASIVVVLVIALVIAFVNLENLINKNKGTLLSKAEQAIGREITLGEIGLSFRGGLGVKLSDVALSDDPSFSQQPLVTAKGLQVNAKILPLFRKEFQVKRVILREPVFNLIRNEDGVLNAMTLAGPSEEGSRQQEAAPLVVSLVNINDGVIHFEDRSDGTRIDITDLDSKVTDFEMGKPLTIELDAAVIEDEKNLAVSGTFGPLADNPDDTPVNARIDIGPIAIATLKTALPALSEGMPPELTLDGPVRLGIDAAGTVGAVTLRVEMDASELAAEMPASFTKTAGTPMTLASDVAVTEERVTLSNLRVQLHTLEASGGGTVTLGESPTARFDLQSKPTSLAGWDAIIPTLAEYSLEGAMQLQAHIEGPLGPGQKPAANGTIKLSDVSAVLPDAAKPVRNVNADVSFTDTTAELRNASLAIGGSTIEGNATISQFEPLSMSYNATSSSLALDDVRLPPKEGTPPRKPTKKPEILRNLAVQGNLTIVDEKPSGTGKLVSGAGSVGDIDYTQLSGNFDVKGEQLDVSDIAVNLLDGSLNGSGTVMMGENPSFEFKTKARALNVVGVMEAIPDVARSHLSGTTNFDLTVSGSGKDWSDIQPTVSGDGYAELLDGALVDINIMKSIVDEISTKTGVTNLISQRIKEKYPQAFTDRSTAFEELKSTFVIEDGKLLVRNMAVNSKDYGFRGVGGIDFERGLNLEVTMTVSQALTADIAKDFDAVTYFANSQGQIEVPFQLQGTLPNVSIKPNSDYINDVVQKALVQEGLNILGDKKLQDGLKDLFKKKK